MSRQEAGRLGGKATLARHGTDHFRTIGKAGFEALAKKLGFAGGGRRGAVAFLARHRQGFATFAADLSDAEVAALYRDAGLEPPPPLELPEQETAPAPSSETDEDVIPF